jgi:hypothetical protein
MIDSIIIKLTKGIISNIYQRGATFQKRPGLAENKNSFNRRSVVNKKGIELSLCTIFILALFLGALALPGLNASAQDAYFTPQLWVVNLPTRDFHVQSWPEGRTVTASIDDPGTVENPDFTLEQVTGSQECGDRPACAFFSLPEGVYLAPYWTITVADTEGLEIYFKLANVKTTSVDLLANIVRGTVDPVVPANRLSVLVMSPDGCDPQGDYVAVDDQGNWTAILSPCDIVPGSWGALNVHSETDDAILIGSWGTPEPAYTLKGFYQPVDMNGVYNLIKGGSGVPFKFEVFDGSTELTDTAEIQSIATTQIACDAQASTDNIETTVAGGANLRYDSADGQFIFNWKTPKAAGACYQVTLTTIDGSSLAAFFKLK